MDTVSARSTKRPDIRYWMCTYVSSSCQGACLSVFFWGGARGEETSGTVLAVLTAAGSGFNSARGDAGYMLS